jgi:TM2 domain-containing membrane protein YozV
MSGLAQLLQRPKSRKVAIGLALLSTVVPWPIAGLHKLYLGQPLWGGIYLLLWNTPIPRMASAIDAVWYFVQGEMTFDQQFNGQINSPTSSGFNPSLGATTDAQAVNVIAEALRELDRLRSEGLVSEYEFEQKRRQLLDRIA